MQLVPKLLISMDLTDTMCFREQKQTNYSWGFNIIQDESLILNNIIIVFSDFMWYVRLFVLLILLELLPVSVFCTLYISEQNLCQNLRNFNGQVNVQFVVVILYIFLDCRHMLFEPQWL
jgi:hypothetical protein